MVFRKTLNPFEVLNITLLLELLSITQKLHVLVYKKKMQN